MPRLGKRLLLIAEAIPPCSRVADIGTDHAVLPIHLVKGSKVSHVIASDIAKKPLEKAAENIRRAGLSDVIELRLSDGLNNFTPQDADTVVIAGMGGELIADILAQASWLKDGNYLLILQPMTRAEKLRKYLRESEFTFIQERAVFDSGRYFTVITVSTQKTDNLYSPFFDYVGLLSTDKQDDKMYLENTARTLRTRASDIPQDLHGTEAHRELSLAAEHIENMLK